MMLKTSPAKLNLYLRVLRRRPDGYHDILSLMQRISLFDELSFSPCEGRILLRCPGSGLPGDGRNIVFRAAEAFFSRLGVPPGIEITLHKRIPVAAGLGGGSSNAATTLMALNEISGSPLTREELMGIGAGLGADVPFFLFEKAAWASGIGDVLREAPPLPRLWFVLIHPGFETSTKTVYEKLNLGLTSSEINYSIPRFSTADDLLPKMTNDLEKVTLSMHPVLDRYKALLIQSGARVALMSGSGPTVFGVFADREAARRAEQALLRGGEGFTVFVAHSL